MNEAERRAEIIDPKLRLCGWGVVEGSKVLREYLSSGQCKLNMDIISDYLQAMWRNGMLPGIDCIVFGNAEVIVANTYRVKDDNAGSSKQYWFPFCDTTISSLEKYEADIWTKIDIFDGAIAHGEQRIVFGEGSMGNEGFVAATRQNGDLIWGMFFTISNPIVSAKIVDDVLICVSETALEITIDLHELTKISIEDKAMW